MSKYYTTLKALRDNGACNTRYDYLVSKIGYTRRKIGLDEILNHNGIEDAIWALCSVKFTQKYMRDWYNFKADCAESVLINYEKLYPNDDRPRKSIEAARNYKNKSAAESAARSAAYASSAASAARSADYAEMSAARSAARSAERRRQKKLFIKYFC